MHQVTKHIVRTMSSGHFGAARTTENDGSFSKTLGILSILISLKG